MAGVNRGLLFRDRARAGDDLHVPVYADGDNEPHQVGVDLREPGRSIYGHTVTPSRQKVASWHDGGPWSGGTEPARRRYATLPEVRLRLKVVYHAADRKAPYAGRDGPGIDRVPGQPVLHDLHAEDANAHPV